MDIYEQKIPAEPPRPLLPPSSTGSTSAIEISPPKVLATDAQAQIPAPAPSTKIPSRSKVPPSEELNRLAARDRAYMLLSTLTRLGSGWDDSQAWYTLARAHELSGEVDKAKSALWWCVELEGAKPTRPWVEVAAGGFTL